MQKNKACGTILKNLICRIQESLIVSDMQLRFTNTQSRNLLDQKQASSHILQGLDQVNFANVVALGNMPVLRQ